MISSRNKHYLDYLSDGFEVYELILLGKFA